jgi:hypothetical protein
MHRSSQRRLDYNYYIIVHGAECLIAVVFFSPLRLFINYLLDARSFSYQPLYGHLREVGGVLGHASAYDNCSAYQIINSLDAQTDR